MIHVSKSKGRYFVATIAKNALELSASQPTGVRDKRAAWKNVRAQLKAWGSTSTLVQDNTGDKPIIYNVGLLGKVVKTHLKPRKPYTPGVKKKKS